MNLDKNSSEETIKTTINDKNTSITNNESNASITNNESNASINDDIVFSTKGALDYLNRDINLSKEEFDVNLSTKEKLNTFSNDINITNPIDIGSIKIVGEFPDKNISKEIIKEEDLNVYYTKNDISSYREGAKPFVSFNGNVLFLAKDNLLVFGEGGEEDKEKLFKINLKQFLDIKKYNNADKIYIYREGNIIECKKSKYNYVDSKGKNIKIYFGDIISDKKEDINNNILDLANLEYQIGNIKINNITKDGKLFKINLDTRFTEKKGVEIFYNLKTSEILFFDGKSYIDKGDFFEKDRVFYKKFRGTFEYFKDNNMFDEPLNEKVLENGKKEQLDGHLREQAINALKRGKKLYNYNGLDYNLYKNGKISIPQVCIDYPLDFYEKLHDSYFDEKGNHSDIVNFEKLLGGFFSRRRVGTFIENLKINKNDINEYFTIEIVDGKKSVAYNDGKIIEEIIKNDISKQVSIGDIILIEGKLSDNMLHRHSVMVSKIQENGNIIIQENAALPVEETLLRVLSRGANRRIKYIVKPTDFLILKQKNTI